MRETSLRDKDDEIEKLKRSHVEIRQEKEDEEAKRRDLERRVEEQNQKWDEQREYLLGQISALEIKR
jgi:hypothetical protein